MPVARALTRGAGLGDLGVTRFAARVCCPVLLVVAIALLFGTPARALFGEPVTISPDGVQASQPKIATDRAGNALAVWTEGSTGARRVHAAWRPAGGDFASVGLLSADSGDADRPQVVFDEGDNALVVWTRYEGELGRVEAAFRPAGGAFGAAQVVSAAQEGASNFDAQVAIDESAVVVWTRQSAAGDLSVQAAFRPKGGAFAAQQTVSVAGQAFEPQVAVDERGNALAVWTQEVGGSPRVFSAFRPRTGDWSASAQISPDAFDASEAHVAVDRSNNAIATWTSDADGASSSDPTFIQAALRPAGGSFGAAETISSETGSASKPEAVFDERGNALVAWSRFDGAHTRVEASFHPRNGGFEVAQVLSPPGNDAFEPRIAVDESAGVVWTRTDGTNLRVQGAFRNKGGRFGAVQTLSEPADDAFEPDIAVDERGNALAVWTRNEGFEFPRVQFAFRPRVASFAEPQGLSAPAVGAFGPHVATDHRNNSLAVWTADPDPLDPSNPTWVEAAFAPAGGSFGAPERLSDPAANAFQPRVAFERDGDAVIAWTGSDSDGTQRVQASFRPAGAGFLGPINLSADGGDAFDPQVSAGAGAVVVWSRMDGAGLAAEAAVKPDGAGFLPPETLSGVGVQANSPQVSVGRGGTAVATWFVAAGDRVDAAVGTTGGGFGPAVTLSAPTTLASEPQVAVDERGNAVVVWTAGNGTTHIQAAHRRAGSTFGEAQDVSEPGAFEPRVVIDESGNALAVWTRFVGDSGQIESAFRPRGGAFGTPALVAASGGGESLSHFGPDVAIDDSAAVVWTAQTAGGLLRVLTAFRPKGGSFGAAQTLSDRHLHGFDPQVAVDERGNARAVWTLSDLSNPGAPPPFSTVESALRPRI